MRISIFAAGVALAALMPSAAMADQSSCERQRSSRVVGTVAGAGIGAVLGNVIAGKGDKTLGTIIGGVGGGVLGNQITKPDADCRHALGYYDKQNRWHSSAIASRDARGYYNRDGDWVDGVPNGYYDSNNRWIASSGDAADQGYYGANGHWVPASANGYYDSNDQWIEASASGHYDSRGRWVAGNTNGHYDSQGRWMTGAASGHRDADGNWMTTTQAGHYDSNGRWWAGNATGYYDNRGRWLSASGSNQDDQDQTFAPRNFRDRTTWLDRYIRDALRNRDISRTEGDQSLRELNGIKASGRAMSRNRRGSLSVRDEASLQLRLDRLSARLGVPTRDVAYRN